MTLTLVESIIIRSLIRYAVDSLREDPNHDPEILSINVALLNSFTPVGEALYTLANSHKDLHDTLVEIDNQIYSKLSIIENATEDQREQLSNDIEILVSTLLAPHIDLLESETFREQFNILVPDYDYDYEIGSFLEIDFDY